MAQITNLQAALRRDQQCGHERRQAAVFFRLHQPWPFVGRWILGTASGAAVGTNDVYPGWTLGNHPKAQQETASTHQPMMGPEAGGRRRPDWEPILAFTNSLQLQITFFTSKPLYLR